MFYILLTSKACRVLVAIAMISFSFHHDLTLYFLKNSVVTLLAEFIFLDITSLTE